LQSLPALDEIARCVSVGNHATHLRQVYAETRNAQSMVQEGVRALRDGPQRDARRGAPSTSVQ
jgi:hypothetical protein